ncbi:hypothetical protein [Streptomyces sp. NPDC000229]|uniref:hypothetical protein n=1 Tax=Streptomyces sp. NPDC000229 TaxID=3154247 RepID=UPI0033205A63
MRFALRTAVATAVLAGAALTPVATATAAFATGGTQSAAGAVKPASSDAAQPATPETKPAADAKPASSDAAGSAAPATAVTPDTEPATPADTKPATPADKPEAESDGKREPVRTVQLVEGMSAQVFRVDGTLEADVYKAGKTLFTLKAGEKRTYNRVEVLLKADGRVIPRQVDEDMGALIRTGTLKNGTYVKIYQVNSNHHRADTFIDGVSVGVLDANGRSAASQNDVQYFVLNPDGSTYNWLGLENVVTGAKAGMYKLPNGQLIQIVKSASGRYGISACDSGGCPEYARMVQGTDNLVLRTGSSVVVLNWQGTFSHHVIGAATQTAAVYVGAEVPGTDKGGDKGTGKGAAKPTPAATTGTTGTTGTAPQGTTSQTSVVPKGGVAAGAETAGDGGNSLLIASGAGAAALSAAGLGFVAMRRRQAADRG